MSNYQHPPFETSGHRMSTEPPAPLYSVKPGQPPQQSGPPQPRVAWWKSRAVVAGAAFVLGAGLGGALAGRF